MTEFLYAPNLHLFSYYKEESNWNKPNKITFDKKIDIKPNQPIPITGFALYFKQHDTYNLNFKICVPEEYAGKTTENLPLNIFSKLNTEKDSFLPAPLQDSLLLGETIILTGTLETLPHAAKRSPEDLKKIATECVKEFNSKLDLVPLQSGELFGSPIFEFLDKNNPKTSPQIIVWLYIKEETSTLFNDYYRDFSNLFLYFHKNNYVYHNSQELETKSTQLYQKITNEITGISIESNQYHQKHLDDYNKKLSEIYIENSDYTKGYTALEFYQNAIIINTKNYQNALNELQHKVPNQDLKFFQTFFKKSQQYQEQIAADLNYFSIRLRSLEQQTNTIRGLIEIEQAEITRDLQNTLQALATGLAAGAIVASCLPYVIKQEPEKPIKSPITLPQLPFNIPPLHPFTLTLIISFGAGLLAWFIVSLRLQGKRFLLNFLLSFLPKNSRKKLSPRSRNKNN